MRAAFGSRVPSASFSARGPVRKKRRLFVRVLGFLLLAVDLGIQLLFGLEFLLVVLVIVRIEEFGAESER